MKYWNKDKELRLQWAYVPPPASHLIPVAKRWCQQQASTHRFYFHYTNTRWWFENEHDATLFSLTWGARRS